MSWIKKELHLDRDDDQSDIFNLCHERIIRVKFFLFFFDLYKMKGRISLILEIIDF